MDKKPIRVVHVEDSHGWRIILGGMFENGLAGRGVAFESREDFKKLNEEIESQNPDDLPDALILDNEAPGGEGGEIAQAAHKKAKELGKNIIIINLLCSAPDKVREKYGLALDDFGIPILNKTTDAALCAFYIGACITENGELKKINFQDWVREEEINLPKDDSTEIREVQDKLVVELRHCEPGALYLKPKTFIQQHLQVITESMRPGARSEMEKMFPALLPGGEKK